MDADPQLAALDPFALRRRVLLTAVVTFVLFLTAAYLITALDASGLWLLPVLVLLVLGVVRPLMRPVSKAITLRRALAYQAFLEQRDQEQRGLDEREPQP